MTKVKLFQLVGVGNVHGFYYLKKQVFLIYKVRLIFVSYYFILSTGNCN